MSIAEPPVSAPAAAPVPLAPQPVLGRAVPLEEYSPAVSRNTHQPVSRRFVQQLADKVRDFADEVRANLGQNFAARDEDRGGTVEWLGRFAWFLGELDLRDPRLVALKDGMAYGMDGAVEFGPEQRAVLGKFTYDTNPNQALTDLVSVGYRDLIARSDQWMAMLRVQAAQEEQWRQEHEQLVANAMQMESRYNSLLQQVATLKRAAMKGARIVLEVHGEHEDTPPNISRRQNDRDGSYRWRAHKKFEGDQWYAPWRETLELAEIDLANEINRRAGNPPADEQAAA